MLNELQLTNFRIFNDKVTVRFRPITVFIGRNSAGKSSIIKFLLMLQQSGPGTPYFLNPEGEKVNLGVFPRLKNSLTRKTKLTFTLTATAVDSSLIAPISPLLDLSPDFDLSQLRYRTFASVPYSLHSSTTRATYSLIHPRSDENLLQANLKNIPELSLWGQRPPPIDFAAFPSIVATEETSEDDEERMQQVRAALTFMTEFLVIGVSRHQVASLSHLSPVRQEAQRVIEASAPPYNHVGQRGEFTLPHLQQLLSTETEEYEFIRPHLESVAGIDRLRFRTSSRYVSQAFAKNKMTGADVLIADYGFGVSQCLPILVQGAIMAPNTTLMVEQPEAQLHPTAQLELGSYFADLWNTRRVGAIIETHSGNILLRLRRLIARGDLCHQDVAVAFFDTDETKAGMATIRNLEIRQDGSMEPGLPMEFFGADVVEGLQLGAGA